ncbi:hypothetical protein [Frankia sp. QA3]|uniref:hypothetical protein n=1 Tax=Frankia sp. QA3 TaxID=710111 RepID=UPI000269CFA6|nr:hypothetical protein [Frankia sp. QA3]EIV96363.1 hypothetical protein FraQA3DRAFT_6254 [Frankia sp. QA3]
MRVLIAETVLPAAESPLVHLRRMIVSVCPGLLGAPLNMGVQTGIGSCRVLPLRIW